ncbi:MAG: AmmeMemoRadiSam system protein B [Rhodospirillales bacterium]
MNLVRPAAVAGTFYPDDPPTLRRMVEGLLDAAPDASGPLPKAIIAPHAGYRYSGQTAARVYARLRPLAGTVRRVVLLGPCHRVAVRGLAAPSVDAFTTPLGDIPLDRKAIGDVATLPQVSTFDSTHAEEHSLEVHLPFLQVVLGDFELVPLVVGDAGPKEVAQVLDDLWGGPETLIVVSSDLSHFLDYDSAREIDGRTCAAIEALEGDAIEREGACGRHPVRGLLRTAKDRNLRVETVHVCNSGDTAGPRDRVVGYGAWAFYETDDRDAGTGTAEAESDPTAEMLERFGGMLLQLAGASIVSGVRTGKPCSVDPSRFPPDLAAEGACFVTLKKNGQLRGCIGSPEAHRPLILDVAQNAYRAAFHDPRFPAVTEDEVRDLTLSISVLSPQTPMSFRDESDLLAQLQPGIDGLVIADGPRRALFLPSVWQQLPERETFVAHLKRKAGMPADHWSPAFKASRFTAHELSQRELDEPMAIWRI